MAITTPADPRWATNTGNSYFTVDPGTAADNIFIFANGSEKLRYVPDGPYRAIATCYGGGDVTSRLQAVLNDASVKEVLVDTQAFTISGTLTIPTGKVLSFGKGGSLSGSGTISGRVQADYGQNIFAQTLVTTNVSSATGKVSLEWWTPAGDGTTADSTAITKAFSTQTKHVIVGKPTGSVTYAVGNTGTYTGFAVGTIAEFLPGAKVKPNSPNLVSFGSKIIAHDAQHIIEVSDASVRLSTPEDSGNRYISCRWTGCQGDETTDDTIPMQVAANWAANAFSSSAFTRVPLYLAPGKYLCDNVYIRHSVYGAEKYSSVRAFTAGEYAFLAGQQTSNYDVGSWVYAYFRDFCVQGENISSGIKFSNNGTDDHDVGRWAFERIVFNKCIISVDKSFGNIGNTFTHCSFTFGDVAYFAKENTSPVMHTGNDYFYNCHFKSIQKACIYIDQSQNGGNHHIQNCIFEYNPGFAVCINQYGNALHPFVLDNCHIEGNGSAGAITIDGNSFTADVNFLFQSTKAAYINYTSPISMRVKTGSIVHVTGCNMYNGDAEVEKDSDCVVVFDKMFGFQINNNTTFNLTPPICDPDSSASMVFKSGYPRSVKNPGLGYLTSRSGQTVQATGFPSAAGGITIVDGDGVIYNKCWEVPTGTPGSAIQVLDSVSVTGAKFVVCNAALKKVSGTGSAQIQFVNAAGALFTSDSTDWVYFTKILYTGAGSSSYAQVIKGDVVFRVSCVQMHLFSTFQEAYEFTVNNQFVSTETPYRTDVGLYGGKTFVGGTASGDDITFSSTSHPTKGDIIHGSTGTGLTIHEADNNNISHGTAGTWNMGANTSNYRVFSGSDISGGGSVAHYVFEYICTQRDTASGGDPTKILGRSDWFNAGSTVPSAKRHAGRVLVRADGATTNARGGRYEIWLKENNVDGVQQVFAIDNTGKAYLIRTQSTAAAGHYPLYRNNSTGEITQGSTVAAVDSVDKFTLTATGSRTITTGETLLYIHLKSDASITVDIGTSAAGTDIATGMALTSGQTKILAVPMTADSTITVHFTYTSGSGNIDVIHVKKIY